jgi:hypothetical protein
MTTSEKDQRKLSPQLEAVRLGALATERKQWERHKLGKLGPASKVKTVELTPELERRYLGKPLPG